LLQGDKTSFSVPFKGKETQAIPIVPGAGNFIFSIVAKIRKQSLNQGFENVEIGQYLPKNKIHPLKYQIDTSL